MAILPTYRRQTLATGVRPSGGASSNVSPSSPEGQALQGLSQDLNRVAAVAGQEMVGVAQQERERIENEAAITTANTLSEGQVYWQQNFDERTKAWTPGQPDMRDGINKDFDQWSADAEAKLPTEKSKLYFKQHAATMKSRMLMQSYEYQQKATTSALNAQTAVGLQADENLVYGDPAQFQSVRDRRVETIRARTDLSEAEKITAVSKYDAGLALASERGQLERDPAGWWRARFGEPSAKGAPMAGGAGGIKAAIFGQESNSGKADTSKFNTQGVTGPMQVQQGTFDGMKRMGLIPQSFDITNPEQNKAAGDKWIDYLSDKYSGDPAKIAAAYYGGEKAVRADGSINRDMKNLSRPSDPTVGQYVDQVLSRMKPDAPLLASTNGADAGPLTMPGERGAAGQPIAGAPSTFRALDWEKQSALMQMANTKIQQGDARYKAGIMSQIQDAKAMHADGIVDPVPMTEAQFARAFPEDGSRLYAEYQNSRLMAADIGRYKSLPAADIAASVAAGVAQPGAGYAAADAREKNRQQAAQHIMQQRKADPAGYVTQNTPELAGLAARINDPATAAADKPALTQQYVQGSLAEQGRLGIVEPKILTPSQAAQIGQVASSATRPEDSANLIGSLENQYGKYFPRVFNELVAGKHLANEMLIIPNLPTPAARETVSRLSRVKETDLTQGIDAKDQKTVKDLVVTALEPVAASVALPSDQSSATMNAYEITLRKMAYAQMSGGASPSEAVERAQTLLLGQYAFVGSMRLPKSINESAAKQGTQSRLYDSLDAIDVPRDQITGARSLEEQKQEWQRTVRARPLWFTNDDDSGVTLWATGSNGVRYKVTQNGGKPVTFNWAELQAPTRTPNAVPQDMGRPAIGTGEFLRRSARQNTK